MPERQTACLGRKRVHAPAQRYLSLEAAVRAGLQPHRVQQRAAQFALQPPPALQRRVCRLRRALVTARQVQRRLEAAPDAARRRLAARKRAQAQAVQAPVSRFALRRRVVHRAELRAQRSAHRAFKRALHALTGTAKLVCVEPDHGAAQARRAHVLQPRLIPIRIAPAQHPRAITAKGHAVQLLRQTRGHVVRHSRALVQRRYPHRQPPPARRILLAPVKHAAGIARPRKFDVVRR